MKSFWIIALGFLWQYVLLSQDIEYARSIISQLASPDFKGRGYVEGGDKLAASLIKNEFVKFSALPLFKSSYEQEFQVAVNTFPNEVLVNLNGKELIPGSDFLIEPSCPQVKESFPIIPIQRMDLMDHIKLSAIIQQASFSYLLIDNSDKLKENTAQTKKIDDVIRFLKYSDEIQFKGLIIYSDEKLTWDASSLQNVRPVILLHKAFDLDTLKEISLSIDSKYLKRYTTQNVAAKIEGSINPDSFIVVTAHYDHLGMMGKNVYFPGANDNASGVAMLLNLANYYSKNKPKYTMVFVALGAEELGLLGAFQFVGKPPIDLKKIKFLVNFDLVGTGDEGIKVVNGSIYKKEFEQLNQLNKKEGLLPKIEMRGKACNSDHCAFDKEGIPCFYIYTLGGIKAYHDIYDRYETLPLTEFSDYCKLMIDFFNSM